VIDRRSSVGFFYSKKIGTGQFGTFATISAHSVVLNLSCRGLLIEGEADSNAAAR
jgi:hypothetical protein